jgi:hypothetical protein
MGALVAKVWAKENDAQIRAESATDAEADKKVLDQSTFAGTIAGCIVGGPVGCDTGGMTGRNAVENNYLTQPASVRDPKVRQRILDAGQNCAGPSSCEGMVAGMDAQIKLLSDDKIAAMCGTSAQCVTDRKDERGLYVQARNDAQYRLDNPDALALSYLRDQKNAPYDKDKLSASVTRVKTERPTPTTLLTSMCATLWQPTLPYWEHSWVLRLWILMGARVGLEVERLQVEVQKLEYWMMLPPLSILDSKGNIFPVITISFPAEAP